VNICASHDIWAIIGGKITDILNSITLDTLVKMTHEKEKKNRTHNNLNMAENLQ
jgi:DNA-binding IscR family transcriptional regulator